MKFNKHGIANILILPRFTGIWTQVDTDLILPILDEEGLI